MDDQNVAIRLKGFIEAEGLSNSQFADRCGIPRPSLSQLLTGRNKKISDVIVGQIHKAFPQLSVLWLMFGEGPMVVPVLEVNDLSSSSDETSFPEGSLFADAPKFASNDTNANIGANVRGLNDHQNTTQPPHFKKVEDDKKISELQKQIEFFRKNPRKVSHITVYYDDSTFETFYPK